MEQFILILRNDARSLNLSPQELQDQLEKWLGWRKRLQEKGQVVFSERIGRNGLQICGSGRAVSETTGAPVIALLLINAVNIAEAVAIARDCPVYDLGGSLEIRPVQTLDVV